MAFYVMPTSSASTSTGVPGSMTISFKMDITTSGAHNGLFITTGIQNGQQSQLKQFGFIQPALPGAPGAVAAIPAKAALPAIDAPESISALSPSVVTEKSREMTQTATTSVVREEIPTVRESTFIDEGPVELERPPMSAASLRREKPDYSTRPPLPEANRSANELPAAPKPLHPIFTTQRPETPKQYRDEIDYGYRLLPERTPVPAPERVVETHSSSTKLREEERRVETIPPSVVPSSSIAAATAASSVGGEGVVPFRLNTFGSSSSTLPYVQVPTDLVLNDTTTTTTTVEVFRAQPDPETDYYRLPPPPADERDDRSQLIRARGPAYEVLTTTETRFGADPNRQPPILRPTTPTTPTRAKKTVQWTETPTVIFRDPSESPPPSRPTSTDTILRKQWIEQRTETIQRADSRADSRMERSFETENVANETIESAERKYTGVGEILERLGEYSSPRKEALERKSPRRRSPSTSPTRRRSHSPARSRSRSPPTYAEYQRQRGRPETRDEYAVPQRRSDVSPYRTVAAYPPASQPLASKAPYPAASQAYPSVSQQSYPSASQQNFPSASQQSYPSASQQPYQPPPVTYTQVSQQQPPNPPPNTPNLHRRQLSTASDSATASPRLYRRRSAADMASRRKPAPPAAPPVQLLSKEEAEAYVERLPPHSHERRARHLGAGLGLQNPMPQQPVRQPLSPAYEPQLVVQNPPVDPTAVASPPYEDDYYGRLREEQFHRSRHQSANDLPAGGRRSRSPSPWEWERPNSPHYMGNRSASSGDLVRLYQTRDCLGNILYELKPNSNSILVKNKESEYAQVSRTDSDQPSPQTERRSRPRFKHNWDSEVFNNQKVVASGHKLRFIEEGSI